MSRTDRRATDRMRLAFPVLLQGPSGAMRRCIARDVSARGLFVETLECLPPGTRVRVTFALPDGTAEMRARCVVRHVVRLDAPDGALHGMGLSFALADDEDRDERDDDEPRAGARSPDAEPRQRRPTHA